MSFYLSVSRAVGGALVVLAVVVLIAVAALGSGGKKNNATPTLTPTHTPTQRATPTTSRTASSSPTPTATASTPSPKGVTVNVLNGTTRPGLARTLATKLSHDGYTIRTVGNATAQSTTTIYYQRGKKADAEALLARHPELGSVAAATSSTPGNAALTVIIGSDYSP
jgi:hypothetical protein